MKSAQALDGHHQPGRKSLRCFRNRVRGGNLLALSVPHLDLWTAAPACIRLSMKAAVQRLIVFRLALWADAEGSHRRIRAVVGDVADNGEARAALGAVDERIQVAPVAGIKQPPK